jgi:hypothetical protein
MIHEQVPHMQIQAANVAALLIPVGTIMLHAPVYLAAGTGLMSFTYYTMIVIDKLIDWRKRWKKRNG